MIDAKEAERLAQAHVGAEAQLVHCAEPPPGLYLARPDAEFLFLVFRLRQPTVGARLLQWTGSPVLCVLRAVRENEGNDG